MKHSLLILTAFTILALSCKQLVVQNKIDLSGTWQYAMDPSDKGVAESWFNQVLRNTLS